VKLPNISHVLLVIRAATIQREETSKEKETMEEEKGTTVPLPGRTKSLFG